MTTTEKTKQQVYIRVGHHYVKTIGCHGVLGGRSFELPVDTAFNSKGLIYVAGRAETTPRVTIIDIDENFRGEFGTPGVGGDGQLRWPGGIAIDSADRVYITEQHTQKMNVYDESGGLITRWGRYGSERGEFKEPTGIVLDSEDNMYLADAGNHRVQKFSSDGKFIMTFGTHGSGEGEFNMPWGIALDGEGNVFVSDWGNNRVQKFTADGEFIMEFGEAGDGNGQFRRPSGVSVDRGGDIYVADWGNDRVQVFDPKGVYQLKFTGDAIAVEVGSGDHPGQPGLRTGAASSDAGARAEPVASELGAGGLGGPHRYHGYEPPPLADISEGVGRGGCGLAGPGEPEAGVAV